jgi:hypothetical protein
LEEGDKLKPRKLTAPGKGKSRGFVIGHCPLPTLGGTGERRANHVVEGIMATSQRVSRGFHRLGLFLAAITMVVGFVLIAMDVVHLKLWDVGANQLPMVIAGFLVGLLEVGLVCLAVYGLVRAIGWIIGGFAAS